MRHIIVEMGLLCLVALYFLIAKAKFQQNLMTPLLQRTSPPHLKIHSRWPPNKLVVVPAIWKEIDWANRSSWPQWLHNGLQDVENNSAPYHVHLYQRIDPKSRPPYNWPYCLNVHEEAGVYLKFIYEHYHDLPEKILFLHGDPFVHSPHPIAAALCIRDDVHYTSVNTHWIENRRWTVWNQFKPSEISLMYLCANRLLKIFEYNAELQLNPTNHSRKDESIISTPCCAQFYVTKQRIHHYSYKQWSDLYQASLEPYCVSEADRERPGEHSTKWFGGSLEHLWHVILGLQPTNMPLPINGTNTDRCHIFRSSCPGSLC